MLSPSTLWLPHGSMKFLTSNYMKITCFKVNTIKLQLYSNEVKNWKEKTICSCNHMVHPNCSVLHMMKTHYYPLKKFLLYCKLYEQFVVHVFFWVQTWERQDVRVYIYITLNLSMCFTLPLDFLKGNFI